MIKKRQKPILSIVIAIAVIFTLVEGAIYVMQVMERGQNNDMETTYHELRMVLDMMDSEKLNRRDLPNFCEDFQKRANDMLNESVTLYLINSSYNVIQGDSRAFRSISNLNTFQYGKDYYDDISFIHVISELPDAEIVVVSKAHEDANFLGRLADYKFIFRDKVYFELPFVIADGEELILVLEKPLTMSGHSIQQMAMVLIVYGVVLLVLWIISMCQAIARNDDFNRLLKIAYFDELTGISNHKKFELNVSEILRIGRYKKYALISVDICKFKIINDFYGEDVANDILKGIAELLKKETAKEELVARDQGDIFLLLWRYDTLEKLDDRIKRMDTKMCWAYAEQSVHFRYGVYPIPEEPEDVARMINFASMARDRNEENKETNIGYLDNDEREQLRWEKVLEGEMETALLNKEFTIYLQPKFLTDGSRVGGAEALVRWDSPSRGRISPGDFIPLFERNGFIMKLDDYMLEEVCKEQRKWLNDNKELITISVNVSRVHLMDANLVQGIVAIVDRYHLPHSCIELELTESAFFDDKQVLVNTIRRLQSHGFKVSMDDFGAGYSSLNSLKDLPLDVIKLDAEFFHDARDPERGEKIIKNTIEMAKNLNMKIVAEGIEKEEQVKFLDSIGCDLIQGFYFAKPMTVKEFEMLVYKG